MSSLAILKQHSQQLMLAEAIGWLHDYFKCSEENIVWQATHHTSSSSDILRLVQENNVRLSFDFVHNIHSQVVSIDVKDLLHQSFYESEFAKGLLGKKFPKMEEHKDRHILLRYLNRCHGSAHLDKPAPSNKNKFYKTSADTKISTPFGYEKVVGDELFGRLRRLPWDCLKNFDSVKRKKLLVDLKPLFSNALGDTRWPINEVDLWSWGVLVGSLFKAALAGALLLGYFPEPNELRWRLLAVRVNGLDYISQMSRIPDILARKHILEDGLNKVSILLEEKFPIGSEVYRDEDGCIYVVPDLPNLLELKDEQGLSLEKLIQNEFMKGTIVQNGSGDDRIIGGEIIPQCLLESEPWWGQVFKKDVKKDKSPNINHFLSKSPISCPSLNTVKGYWTKATGNICLACGLRPQGPSRKAAERSVCDICVNRRENRSREWAINSLKHTIWADEVADINGKLALIVGRFHLNKWLNGEHVKTTFFDPPCNGGKGTPKTPTFSRMRRIWETTHHFWKEVQCYVTESRKLHRLKIIPEERNLKLYPFHVYEIPIGKTSLNVVWVKEGYFLSASNLGYIARQLGTKKDVYCDVEKSARYVQEHLTEKSLSIRNPDAGENADQIIKFKCYDCQLDASYAPIIPVLTEPSVFMMFVPADACQEIISFIKEKYELEMGKVRDRLPISLGIICSKRKMPVRSLMGVGRTMLERPICPQYFQIHKSGKQDNFIDLMLTNDHHNLSWRIPIKMGDSKTQDLWYPYLLVKSDSQSSGEKNSYSIVHVEKLLPNDPEQQVKIRPSTLDFIFLDSNARRFKVFYKDNGQRRNRPYYLEDLNWFQEIWENLQSLSTAQLHRLVYSIEATRDDWFDNKNDSLGDRVFKQFVSDTFAGATWQQDKWKQLSEEEKERIIEAGVRGVLKDIYELYVDIYSQIREEDIDDV